ncbi:trypsin-like serine protease [Micromonospora sp. NPDC005413]|uniref:S1 family peptidase n=1 Tax=Micromonospora sp. NPDC005413 TaxID=3154563 RepID=UPI0033A0E4EF
MKRLTAVFQATGGAGHTRGGRIARAAVLLAALLVTAPLVAPGSAAAAPAPIIGGETQTDADGLAAVLIDGQYNCSGSIVDNYWVLTARHCIYSGSTRIADSRISVRVKSIYYYSGGGVVNVADSRVRTNHDIAMLKLNRSANAQPVRLPTATTKVGATTYAFGWGRTCSTCSPSAILRRATQNVTSINDTDYHGGRAIRTTGLNGDSCFGDSGGPLFKLVDGLRYQVGVLSMVSSGCTGTAYWATVPESRDWISDVMATV